MPPLGRKRRKGWEESETQMKHKSAYLEITITLLSMITLLVACNTAKPSTETPMEEIKENATEEYPPKAANAATAIAEKGVTAWSIVIIGDSLVAEDWSSLPDIYSEGVAEDLGIEIKINNLGTGGLTCESFLPSLKEYSFKRDPIQNADIVLVSLGGGDLLNAGEKYFKDKCDDEGGRSCLEESLKEFQACWDEFLGELTTLAPPDEKLIRIIIPGAFFQRYEDQEEKYDSYLKFQDDFYTYQIQSSEAHGITILDLYHFEEPEGFRMGDNIHVSQEGKKLIANMLRDLGYAYSKQE